jgi:hypothetical protein
MVGTDPNSAEGDACEEKLQVVMTRPESHDSESRETYENIERPYIEEIFLRITCFLRGDNIRHTVSVLFHDKLFGGIKARQSKCNGYYAAIFIFC